MYRCGQLRVTSAPTYSTAACLATYAGVSAAHGLSAAVEKRLMKAKFITYLVVLKHSHLYYYRDEDEYVLFFIVCAFIWGGFLCMGVYVYICIHICTCSS